MPCVCLLPVMIQQRKNFMIKEGKGIIVKNKVLEYTKKGYDPRETLKGNRDTSSIVNGGKAEYGHSHK